MDLINNPSLSVKYQEMSVDARLQLFIQFNVLDENAF